jgi:phosphotransferase system, enzyme I, PtsP
MEHTQLLCNISELNHLFRENISIEYLLERIVDLICSHMQTSVCSIYLYDQSNKRLTLRASHGLSPESINKVSLELGEGITGTALKEMRAISVHKASSDPRYKHFAGINEEQYDNFLAVPIHRGIERIGVIVLQREKKKKFTENDILACRAVSSQLANMIENVRFIMDIHEQHANTAAEAKPVDKVIRGRSAAKGFAVSGLEIYDQDRDFKRYKKLSYDKNFSIKDFHDAITATAEQLKSLQKKVEQKLNDAAAMIFTSHLMILQDRAFTGEIETLISEGQNPPVAVITVAEKYINLFSQAENSFVREKVQDVEDLSVRIIKNIIREKEESLELRGKIVAARDLFPSELLRLSSEEVGGIILVSGGVTSHLSILARSLQVPMVIANDPAIMQVDEGTQVLLDADSGNIYFSPEEEVIREFERRNKERLEISAAGREVKPQTYTADGTRVTILANINLLSDLKQAREVKCEGIGLYRTEFPFIIRSDFPSEQEQYITYKRLIDGVGDKPVIFRTLDVGGDKVLSYYHDAKEMNPAIGLRSIRFSLQNIEVFEDQIKAILRAGSNGDIGIMFPMISSLEEFETARAIVEECKQQLKKRGEEHISNPKIGLMLELPSLVEIIDDVVRESDFISIGTNDFIQFMVGVDRTNEKVSEFYIQHHPAVMRALRRIVETANRHGKPVSMCGSMAGDQAFLPFLLGIGLRTLSISPSYIPEAQSVIEKIDISRAQKLADDVCRTPRIAEIAKLLKIEHDPDAVE